ncbi:hypothetical protein MSC49_39740 (plasmid) [Methylosinus sp. C49]|nr:hypothetical protein MSC49_39740 [Methylosinus sp. C49]
MTRSATGPPTALDETADPAHRRVGPTEARTAGVQLSRRQRRGFHPDSALAIDSDEGAPAVRETLGLRSPSRRAMQGYARRLPGSRLADPNGGIGCPRRREIAASTNPTPAERPARAAGSKGARLSARLPLHSEGRESSF